MKKADKREALSSIIAYGVHVEDNVEIARVINSNMSKARRAALVE